MNLSQKAFNTESSFAIALDGPSASGKGLIAKMLAKEFFLEYIQSSIVYRGLAYLCIKNNIDPENIGLVIELSKNQELLMMIENVDLNQEEIGNYASKISAISEVRNNLNKQLFKLLHNKKRIIMEGRDTGTVTLKDADLKIFITANVETRAKRRYDQLQLDGKGCIFKDVLKSLEDRDLRDLSRKDAPLSIASDALVIDTTSMLPEEVIFKIKEHIANS